MTQEEITSTEGLDLLDAYIRHHGPHDALHYAEHTKKSVLSGQQGQFIKASKVCVDLTRVGYKHGLSEMKRLHRYDLPVVMISTIICTIILTTTILYFTYQFTPS